LYANPGYSQNPEAYLDEITLEIRKFHHIRLGMLGLAKRLPFLNLIKKIGH
jgi:hypothetical protein